MDLRQMIYKILLLAMFLSGCSFAPPRGGIIKLQTWQDENLNGGLFYKFCEVQGKGQFMCPVKTVKTQFEHKVDFQGQGAVNISKAVEAEKGPFLTLYFHFKSADLTPDSLSVLEGGMDHLKEKFRGGTVIIKGFTDNIGKMKANKYLAQSRGDKIKDILKAKFPESKFSIESYPLCCYKNENLNEEERQKNRRAEVYLYH